MENTPLTSNKMPKRRYDFGIGGGFVAIITSRWASTIVQEWEQKPSQQIGIVLGLAVCFSVTLLLLDYVLWRWRFIKAIRSGLWASAAIGPYAGLVAWNELAHPVSSQVIGLVSTIVAFVAFYYLDRLLQGKRHHLTGTQQQ
jgi:hypothetical protein